MANLNIYLIKPDLNHQAIIKDFDNREHEPLEIEGQTYHLYAKDPNDHAPAWLAFFEGNLPERMYWDSSQPGVVLLTEIEGRTYALTFGQGRHLLRPDSYEDRFGMRIVLNSVESVRSLEKIVIAQVAGHTLTQSAQATDVGQFGFDIERDLLRAVAGNLTNSPLGEQMSGIDYLAVSVDATLSDLSTLLPLYQQQSELETYKENGFGFVDHMRPESSVEMRARLDALVLEQLANRLQQIRENRATACDLELTIPDVIDFGTITAFRYKGMRQALPPFNDVSLTDYLSLKAGHDWQPTIEALRADEFKGFTADGIRQFTWSVYKSLVGEIELDGGRYVISDGGWYRIDRAFAEELDAFVAKISPYEGDLPLYCGGDEPEYNQLASESVEGLFLFDRDIVHPVFRGPIEFCDLYTEDHGYRDFIHVKRGTSSRALSHVFAQGAVSAELYKGFDRFRDDVNQRIDNIIGREGLAEEGAPSEIRVVYAIIRKSAGNLPFFSKVNLRRACKTFDYRNLPYALKEITFDPNYLIRHV